MHYEGIPRTRPPEEPRDRHGLVRADALLVASGLAPSRTAAQRMISAGRVSGPEGPIAKPSHELPANAVLQVTADDEDRYVSRGGLKLAGALARTGLDVRGRVCLDVGQSTGGFTDCLIQAGAARVVGVDVGRTQLHPRLRGDARITCIEEVNCRALTKDDLGGREPADGFALIVADVSFISLTLVLPQLPPLLAADGDMLLLVKPQFEVGKGEVGKGGVVRDEAKRRAALEAVKEAARGLGFAVRGEAESPIEGPAGNREWLLALRAP